MSVKALGIGLKLTFERMNQFKYYETWVFTLVVIFCCLLQVNYLNKVNIEDLDSNAFIYIFNFKIDARFLHILLPMNINMVCNIFFFG